MGRPPKIKPEPVLGAFNMSLFTDQELLDLKKEAEDELTLESKTKAAAAFKEQEKQKIRQEKLFADGKDAEGEDLELVLLDLAPHSPNITLDGRQYFHGFSYKFTQAQAATVKDAAHRTWEHEREIGGANMNAERGYRPLNKRIA